MSISTYPATFLARRAKNLAERVKDQARRERGERVKWRFQGSYFAPCGSMIRLSRDCYTREQARETMTELKQDFDAMVAHGYKQTGWVGAVKPL